MWYFMGRTESATFSLPIAVRSLYISRLIFACELQCVNDSRTVGQSVSQSVLTDGILFELFYFEEDVQMQNS